MKKNKIITSLAGVAAVAVPVVAVTACTNTDGNKQIQWPGNPATANLVGETWTKCSDVNSRFLCYDNGTATLVETKNEKGILVVPATVLYNGSNYKVTEIADLAKKEKVDGLDFSQATNLTRVDDCAFQHWSLQGYKCDWDFSNTKLEYIGNKAFDNAMAEGLGERYKNLIDVIKFPNTIKYIGEQAFGQSDAEDPKTDNIIFTTTDEKKIKNIHFGSNWQPHKDDGCSVCVPTENLINVYNGVNNFNPRGFNTVAGICVRCGNAYARFICNDNNKATMVDCTNNDLRGDLVIPATISFNDATYEVTRIAAMTPRNEIDGIDFSQATNLTTIEGHAFEHWYLFGDQCNWDFSNTKLEEIGEKAFDNAMAPNGGNNKVYLIKFPKTIKSIGWEAFGQDSSTDPKTAYIEFTTTDITTINNIQFGSDWQPHKDKYSDCYVYVPTEDLIAVYNGVTNFNPKDFAIKALEK